VVCRPPSIQALPGLGRSRQACGQAAVGAPDEPRSYGDGGEARCVGFQHDLLGRGLGRAVGGFGVRPQRCGLVHVQQRFAGQERGLAAAVDEGGDPRGTGCLHSRSGATDRHLLVALAVGGDVCLGGEVEQYVAACHRVLPAGRLRQFALHRLRAEGRDLVGRGFAADQCADRMTIADKSTDQGATDETRATRDECL
jgi:hypothetical protein